MLDFALRHRETDQNCKTLLDGRFITTKETQKIKLLMIPQGCTSQFFHYKTSQLSDKEIANKFSEGKSV